MLQSHTKKFKILKISIWHFKKYTFQYKYWTSFTHAHNIYNYETIKENENRFSFQSLTTNKSISSTVSVNDKVGW